MKIGIISDIHGYPKKFKSALSYLKDCNIVLCAGDILYHGPRNPILEGYDPLQLVEEIKNCPIPMLIAKGNCESEVDLMVLDLPMISDYVVYEKDGVRFIVNHGHHHDMNSLQNLAKVYKADVIITGHTHVRTHDVIEGVHYINPGSISVPKGDGIPTLCIYEDGNVSFINLNNGENLLYN